MTIHKEGYPTIGLFFILTAVSNFFFFRFYHNNPLVFSVLIFATIAFFFIIVQFFRYPKREAEKADTFVYSPCDGEVVVIEETTESEYFKDKRLQVSIFMSPLNVHANWYPVGGTVKYYKYHPGKFLVAWHPKSSTDNERSTVVIENDKGNQILVRQIAGALARRIVTYAKEGQPIEQNGELGFIKFGSRVDIFLPLGTKVNVALDQKVVGSRTIIANI